MPLLLALALQAPAYALELTTDRPTVSGSSVTFTISGADPGEQVFLAIGKTGTTCPAAIAPSCVEMRRPTILHRYTAAGGDEQVVVNIPSTAGDGVVQAAARSGVSQALSYGPSNSPAILFTGVLASCSVDQVDLDAEYITPANDVTATAYRDGSYVQGHAMNVLPSVPGAVFFYAAADQIPASDCSQLTWVFEASNADSYNCVVQGPEEDALVASGELPPSCRTW